MRGHRFNDLNRDCHPMGTSGQVRGDERASNQRERAGGRASEGRTNRAGRLDRTEPAGQDRANLQLGDSCQTPPPARYYHPLPLHHGILSLLL